MSDSDEEEDEFQLELMRESSPEEEEAAIPEDEREEWSLHEMGRHGYMFEDSAGIIRNELNARLTDDEFFARDPILEGVPVMNFQSVILPGEVVPLQRSFPYDEEAAREYVSIKEATRSNILLAVYSGTATGNHGTILLITEYIQASQGEPIKAVGRAMSRARILNVIQHVDGNENATVEKVRDDECLPFEAAFNTSSVLRMPYRIQLKLACVSSGQSEHVVASKRTATRCLHVLEFMKLWMAVDRVERLNRLGFRQITRFATRHIPLDEECKRALHGCVSIDQQLFLLSLIQRDVRAVCRNCEATLFIPGDATSLNDMDACSAYFVNPNDYLHDVVLVREVRSGRLVGEASFDYSWFHGYGWRLAYCSDCTKHIGWQFTSPTYRPAAFYGVTRAAFMYKSADKTLEKYLSQYL